MSLYMQFTSKTAKEKEDEIIVISVIPYFNFYYTIVFFLSVKRREKLRDKIVCLL